MIYHIVPEHVWQAQAADQPYVHESLALEGFIHGTGELPLLTQVANRYYIAEPGNFLILAIDESKVEPEVRWEVVRGHSYPHIYGPLNLDAVVKVAPFPRIASGEFVMPIELE